MANEYSDKFKLRIPGYGDIGWDDERDIDDHLFDVIVGALTSKNRVIEGGAVSAGTGLTVDYEAMTVRVAGTIHTIASGNIAVTGAVTTPEQVNWVYVDDTGTLTANTAPPTGDFVPLSIADASDTAILRLGDLRPMEQDVLGAPVENDCINGTFDVWQRATSHSTMGYGSDDRWRLDKNGSTSINSRQSFTEGQADVPGDPAYYASVAVTSVAGTGNYALKVQRILNVRRYSGKRVCVKFHAKASAALGMAVNFSQNFGSGGSAYVVVPGQKISLSTSWQKFILFFDIPSISGKTIGTTQSYTQMNFWFDAGSDLTVETDSLGQQSGTFDLAEVEVYISDRELPVRRPDEDETLRKCLPYCEKSYQRSIALGTISSLGRHYSYALNAYNLYYGTIVFKAKKIQTPNITIYSPATGASGVGRNFSTGADVSMGAYTIGDSSFELSSSGTLTAGNAYGIQWFADAEI